MTNIGKKINEVYYLLNAFGIKWNMINSVIDIGERFGEYFCMSFIDSEYCRMLRPVAVINCPILTTAC